MRLQEFAHDDLALQLVLNEGPVTDKLKKIALGGAVAAGLGYGALQTPDPASAAFDKSGMERMVGDIAAQPPPQMKTVKPLAMPNRNRANELMMARTANKAGIRGEELVAFLGQLAHESDGFNRLHEKGTKDYFMKKYDPQYAPRTAAILGNTKRGDGLRYRGRGFIQLTGRDNYRMAGDALGLPLLDKPDMAAKPNIAAKIAIWYWKTRVRPNVKDFGDVEAVTKYINPALKHLDTRERTHAHYASMLEGVIG